LVWTGACYWHGVGGFILLHHHLRFPRFEKGFIYYSLLPRAFVLF
jgi:hypothetical protein